MGIGGQQHVTEEGILILDFGSQYTRLIAKAIRELGVYSEILSPEISTAEIGKRNPKALILSGGPCSVYEEGAPRADQKIYGLGLPILGICYGMHLIAHDLGGVVVTSKAEYGTATAEIVERDPIFSGLAAKEPVWMSHGDIIEQLPKGVKTLATTQNSTGKLVAALRNESGSIYGLSFHPEVHHTIHGKMILKNWLKLCGIKGSWNPGNLVSEKTRSLQHELKDKRALIGVSGGVDSSTAAVLTHRAIGERLIPLFVDTGLLRKDEVARTQSVFESLGLHLNVVDASQKFFEKLKGVTDPETKRKAIGETFIRVFEAEAHKLEKSHGKIDVLIQGTIYSDVIESGGAGTAKHADKIKSHHNVGGLPEKLGFQLVEPLREFFKDEVREIGKSLGIPADILNEQPFPGPGLAVRILGEVTPDSIALLQEADAILREEVRLAGLHHTIWQYFAVLLPLRSVAVRGDNRGYGYVLALRAVHSRDGMTADWYRVPHELLEKISSRITNELQEITRVVYDITSKPPATIEWE
ncbi:glutamine-hydrolyzing GMP synthase [Candidatus Acetothermia bacterium]|nr:glutamine-hydrolyzing GMP synthase [Candidatus Acetothermia bacterium]MBI3643862.1 glutamine-hydrolyzing GMP synthase [Candidatus Acetothermia bacterium]